MLAFVGMAATPAMAQTEDGWYGGPGGQQPSTAFDTAEYMWQTANADPVDKIYFNGWYDHYGGLAYIPQPDGGTVAPGAFFSPIAVLGYWRDCNEDGYIGNKLAPSHYGSWSSYLASDPTASVNEAICGPNTPYNPGDGWIHEFLHIGWGANATLERETTADACGAEPPEPDVDAIDAFAARCLSGVLNQTLPHQNPYFIDDPHAHVWFDIGYPGQGSGTSRNLYERGYTWDLHGTLDHADFLGGRIVSNNLPGDEEWAGVPNFGHCDFDEEAGPENGYGRSFMDGENGTCGLYPVWQVKRLYNDSDHPDDRETAVVTVYDEDSDCNATHQEVVTGMTLVEDVEVEGENVSVAIPYVNVSAKEVSPGTAEDPFTTGSLTGTLMHIERGTANYDENAESEDGCASDPSWGDNLEAGGGEVSVKNSVDSMLLFWSSVAGPGMYSSAGEALGLENVPLDAFNLHRGPHWAGNFAWTYVPPGTLGSTGYRIAATFYAYVSDEAFSGFPGTTLDFSPARETALPRQDDGFFTYGSEYCEEIAVGVEPNLEAGWSCDPEVWDLQRIDDGFYGRSFNETTGELVQQSAVLIGDPYHLRDVKCFDGAISEDVPVGAGRGHVEAFLYEQDQFRENVGQEYADVVASALGAPALTCAYAPFTDEPFPEEAVPTPVDEE